MLLMKTPEELAAQLAELERLLASCDETDERKRSTLRRAIAKHHRIIIELELLLETAHLDM